MHGWCIGGGVDLICAVDIRYASADAKFSVREVKLAIVADVGQPGPAAADPADGHLRELALTGKDIDAARAEKIGLVNDVYDDAEASLAAAHATAAEIAANPPLVVRASRTCSTSSASARVSESLRYVAAWNSAFLPSKTSPRAHRDCEKRKPEFTGEVVHHPPSRRSTAAMGGHCSRPPRVSANERSSTCGSVSAAISTPGRVGIACGSIPTPRPAATMSCTSSRLSERWVIRGVKPASVATA